MAALRMQSVSHRSSHNRYRHLPKRQFPSQDGPSLSTASTQCAPSPSSAGQLPSLEPHPSANLHSRRSSLPLEVAGAAHQRDALVHDDLAHPQVVVDPLLDLGVLAEVLGADSRAAESISRVFRGGFRERLGKGVKAAAPDGERGVVVAER